MVYKKKNETVIVDWEELKKGITFILDTDWLNVTKVYMIMSEIREYLYLKDTIKGEERNYAKD